VTVAKALSLASLLKHDRPSHKLEDKILADAVEAFLGAVFLDGGFGAAQQVIQKLWAPLLNTLDMEKADPKSALQAWAQQNGHPLPLYAVESQEGPPHAPHFCVSVTLRGFPTFQARGSSKKQAQEAAAREMLGWITEKRDA
jgi:ribonuclease-3